MSVMIDCSICNGTAVEAEIRDGWMILTCAGCTGREIWRGPLATPKRPMRIGGDR